MDVVAKAEALAGRALNISAQRQEAAKQQKAAQWALVQEKTPEIAKMMMGFNKTFGKPAAIRVEYRGEVILQSGEFQRDRENLSGRFRVRGGR